MRFDSVLLHDIILRNHKKKIAAAQLVIEFVSYSILNWIYHLNNQSCKYLLWSIYSLFRPLIHSLSAWQTNMTDFGYMLPCSALNSTVSCPQKGVLIQLWLPGNCMTPPVIAGTRN